MPDALHWLGITRVDRLISMSNLKYDALVDAGIEVGERVPLPPELVPQDAMVEIAAKKAAGYFTPSDASSQGESPPLVVGRDIKDY
jgi:GTP cyclohydrolase II